ncbi:MAG: MFS transporter, partial [Gemmatimonadota bacterium]
MKNPIHSLLQGTSRHVVVLGTARMADAVANSFLIVVLPLYIASNNVHGRFGLSPAAATGVVLAAFGVMNAFLQPFAGRMSDRLGKRRAFVVGGLLLLTVLNVLYVLAHSYVILLLVRTGQGVAAALTITATVALVNELSTQSNRGGNMGTYNSLRLLGFGVGPLAAGFVVSSGPYKLPGGLTVNGYDAAFYIAAAGALVSASLVAWLIHDPEKTHPTERRVHLAIRSRDGDHLLDPIFALGVATLVMALCIALLASIETHVNARLDQGARWFGFQFAGFILTLSLTQPFVGRASDRWGRRVFVIVGLVLLAPTTLVQGLVVTSLELLLARLAQGIAGAMVFAPALALAGDLALEGLSGLQLSVLTMA